MEFILAPVDLREGTARVVDEAIKLAQRVEAHLIFLHVVDRPKRAAKTQRCAARIAAAEETAERQLLELKASALQRGVNAHSLRIAGNPVAEIVYQAKKTNAMCIVMGARQHGRLYELAIGSTLNAVLKRVSCPVVVVPIGRAILGTRAETSLARNP